MKKVSDTPEPPVVVPVVVVLVDVHIRLIVPPVEVHEDAYKISSGPLRA